MIFSQDALIKTPTGVVLKGPVFLQCGCGPVIAKWASVKQFLSTRIPEAKPKSNRVAAEFVEQEKLEEKIPALKLHQFGVVVARTEKGIEFVDVTPSAAPNTAMKISVLLKRNKEYEQRNNQPA